MTEPLDVRRNNWLKRAHETHGDRFDYSFVQYINDHTNIEIICSIHGKFVQQPRAHLASNGCRKCGFEQSSIKQRLSQEEYIEKVKHIDGGRIEVLGTYINNRERVLHRCGECGNKWNAVPGEVLSGYGCPPCGIMRGNIARRKTHDEYVDEVKKVSSGAISVISTYLDARTPITHLCNVCKKKWCAVPYSILNGTGCGHCCRSVANRKIADWLQENKIESAPEHKFADCVYRAQLIFDFYLPRLNLCIEYDGEQHFLPIKFFGGKKALKKRQARDKAKDTYCFANKIKLLRIPYWKFEEIDQILADAILIDDHTFGAHTRLL